MSLEAIHQLHIFIFVLAITHVVFSVLTMLLGGAKVSHLSVTALHISHGIPYAMIG